MPRGRQGVRRSRPRVLGALLLVVGLLAGCAEIPVSGPVVTGRPIGEAQRGVLRISAQGPKPGATPEEIVRGFLRAAADITDDRHTARQFLTGIRQESWLPDASVVVYPGESQLTTRLGLTAAGTPSGGVRSGGTSSGAPATGRVVPPAEGEKVMVSVSVPVQARVDATGQYAVAAPGDLEQRAYGLVAHSGQWRIGTLSDGVLLNRSDFDTTFADLPVYFPDPTGGWLVPDVRWFPIGKATPTMLVKAVLAGPSAWLAPAVTTGAPPGTLLTASSVPVQDGHAGVDLTGAVIDADTLHRQMLRAQLLATLAGLPPASQSLVHDVTITVEQGQFLIPQTPRQARTGKPAEPGARLAVDPVVDSWPVVIDRSGNLMRAAGQQLTPLPGLAALAGPASSWPAIATDGSAYAVLSGGNRLLHAVAGAKATALVTTRGPLTAPSFDPLGWVWTANAATKAPTSTVYAGRLEGGTSVVPVTRWPPGLTITSLRISRDGTRAVVSGHRAGAGVLFVSAVERNTSQVPVRLGSPYSLLPDLLTARGAAWLDQRRVVVLGHRAGEPEQPLIVEVGGDTAPTAPVPGAVSVTAGNGDIYVGTAGGGVSMRAATTWVPVAAARWPAMPG